MNEASADAPRVVQLRDAAVVETRAGSPEDAILGAIGLYFLAGGERQQWCTPSCGNRARVARHYARRARFADAAQ